MELCCKCFTVFRLGKLKGKRIHKTALILGGVVVFIGKIILVVESDARFFVFSKIACRFVGLA